MKNRTLSLSLALLISALLFAPVHAAEYDLAAGKALLQEHCMSCHGNEIYTLKLRRVKSRSALSTQVQRCQLAQDLNWFEDEVENTAEYLNQEFYHFGR